MYAMSYIIKTLDILTSACVWSDIHKFTMKPALSAKKKCTYYIAFYKKTENALNNTVDYDHP